MKSAPNSKAASDARQAQGTLNPRRSYTEGWIKGTIAHIERLTGMKVKLVPPRKS